MPTSRLMPDLSTPRRWAGAAGLCLLGFLPAASIAAPRLDCEISQGGRGETLQFGPAANPYEVKAVSINERFSFKAVMIEQGGKVDYISLYVYYLPPRGPILLQQAKYLAPAVQPHPASASLTGRQYLYSPRLERELQYECTLLEVAP
ncbi:MAG: hypothetical protein LCH90_09420 [Proteobacteria bacterium]|nr:hypothetical protein [Pseudomonadota bacterium]